MVSLPSFHLDEKRLWQVIGGVLGVSLILVFAAIQFPWWVASYYPDNVQEARGSFQLSDHTVELFRNGESQDCPIHICRTHDYDDGSGMGTVMERTSIFMTLGLVGLIGFLALLVGFYYGKVHSQRLVVSVAFASLGFLVIGIAYFTLTVAEAGAAQVERSFDRLGGYLGGGIGRPDPMFWGIQDVGVGDLSTAPAVGWLLAILGVVNLAFGTILLYQFPEADESEGGYAVDGDSEETTGASSSPVRV